MAIEPHRDWPGAGSRGKGWSLLLAFDAPPGGFWLELLREADARAILGWRYPEPYDFYNPPDDGRDDEYVQAFLDPYLCFHAIRDHNGMFVGFCSYGLDGQVPGGDYAQDALDIGLGMRPGLTGQGHGRAFFEAILKHARLVFAPERFRLTVARFNTRAMRLYEGFGFTEQSRFEQHLVTYCVLMREAR